MNAKTTIELPEDLVQQVKLIALRERKKLKDTFAEIIERGIASERHQPRTPFIPKPSKLRGGHMPTIDEIEAIINSGRD